MTDDANSNCMEYVAVCIAGVRDGMKTMSSPLREAIDMAPYILLRSTSNIEEAEDKLVGAFISSMRSMGGLKKKDEVMFAINFLFSFMMSYRKTLEVLGRVQEKEVKSEAGGSK